MSSGTGLAASDCAIAQGRGSILNGEYRPLVPKSSRARKLKVNPPPITRERNTCSRDNNKRKSTAMPANLPVVGNGASAGGVEALEVLFKSVPADSGLAFVVVTHLAPDGESMLAEILSRATKMPVVDAQDGHPVEAEHDYVLPPGAILTIHDGRLQLRRTGLNDHETPKAAGGPGATHAPRQDARTKSRIASYSASGTRTAVSSPARCSRARLGGVPSIGLDPVARTL